MAQVTKETLIGALHTNPTTDKEIGFNSAIIFILKKLANVEESGADTSDSGVLAYSFKHFGFGIEFNKLSNQDTKEIVGYARAGQKLQCVKSLKESTGLSLVDSKNIVEMFCSRMIM
jgi:ribosomal protein L7/L12